MSGGRLEAKQFVGISAVYRPPSRDASTLASAGKPKEDPPPIIGADTKVSRSELAAFQSQLGITHRAVETAPSFGLRFSGTPGEALKTEITELIAVGADPSALQRPHEGINNLTLYTQLMYSRLKMQRFTTPNEARLPPKQHRTSLIK